MSVIKKLLKNTDWTTYTGRLHMGIDLLARPPIFSLVDDVDLRVHQRRRLPERPAELIRQMEAAGNAIADVIVLARRDGYDLVDRIADAGFTVHLLTPSELRRFSRARNVPDSHDAYWIAHLLRAGALPNGEVYWTGEIRDAHPMKSALVPRPSLFSRLKVPVKSLQLGGNRRFFRRNP
ncbi:MAG: hypothetical protein KJO35_05840 [Gammaproteobacteria bacterium]|nr:hypothetical protein [Gammaproteobacteria bacterium]